MNRILLAEHDPEAARFIKSGLRDAGFVVTSVTDCETVLRHACSGTYKLLLLDLGLPGCCSRDLLRKIRAEKSDVPVIVLADHDEVDVQVGFLNGGADDFLIRPIALEELVARIRLRIGFGGRGSNTELRHGSLILELYQGTASFDGQRVELSMREFALAAFFVRHHEVAITRGDLLRRVWGLDFDPGTNVVDVGVASLRRKLGASRIETVRGVGYRMARPD